MKKFFARMKRSFVSRLRALALVLIVFAALLQPQPAHAQLFGNIDPLAAAHWVTQHAYDIVTDGLKMAIGAMGNVMQGIVAKIQSMASDMRTEFLGASIRQSTENAQEAKIVADAYTPQTTTVCATMKYFYVHAGVMSAASGMREVLNSQSSNVGKGKNGQEGTPAAAAEDVCSLCNSNYCFLSANTYGPLSICGTTLSATDTAYTNADTRLDSLLAPLQYPVPKNITRLPDNHINFKNAAPSPGTPTADEVKYVAAYMVCKNLMPALPTPTYNQSSSASIDAITNIRADRANTILTGIDTDACHAALAYRTSCPQASAASFQYVGAAVNCYSQQKAVCHALKDPPPAGKGIVSIGDAAADYALAHCDSDGLSPAMADKINAYRCASPGYFENEGIAGNIEAVKREQAECAADIQKFHDDRLKEADDLRAAAHNLYQMRGAGVAPNPLAQPASGQ